MRTRQLGGRRTAASLAALSAAAVGLAGLTTPASAVGTAVLADEADAACVAPYTGTLADGQVVTGKTVVKGTTPQTFSGTILGSLKNGIAPGIDMILADLTGATVDENGVWAGMSGSPVYAEDGSLVGAVAYTLNEGKTTVAGITPAAAVLAVRDGGDSSTMRSQARKASVGRAMAGRIAASGAATRAQASSGMRALPSPISISGLSDRRYDQLEGWFDDLGTVVNGGSGSQVAAEEGDGPGPEAIVNGGNLVASLGYGYVAAAATGTVTDVCDGAVVGFGHPFTYGGPSTLGLHAADAVGIYPPGLFGGFKLANPGAPIGTIDNDRLAGISGQLGDLPDYFPVSAFASDKGGDKVGGTTEVSVADLVADAGLATTFTANDRALDRYGKGSARSVWTITGERLDGTSFDVSWDDLYASSYDIASAPVTELARQLYTLLENPTEAVTITSIAVDSDFTDAVNEYRIGRTFQVVGGTTKRITNKTPAVVKAGTTGTVLVELFKRTSPNPVLVPVTVAPAKKSAGRSGILTVQGGFSGDDDYYFYDEEEYFFDEYGDEMLGGDKGETIPEAIARIEGQPHNNDLVTQLNVRGTPVAKGRTSIAGKAPAASVVSGFVAVPVKVTR